MTTKTTASTQWIKKNMIGYYSEELGRPLTEAEVRFKHCTEQLPVPEWYRKYRKPYASKYLKDCTPIESRPSLWKTLASGGSKSSSAGSPKKKKRLSPKNTPKKAQQVAEPPRTSSADSGFGDTFCLSSRTLKSSIDASESSFAPCSTSSPSPPASNASDSDVFESPKSSKNDVRAELDSSSNSDSTIRRRLNNSNSFPRISPSRKIEHINLIFSKPFPPEEGPLTVEDVSNALNDIDSGSEDKETTTATSSTPKTYYSTTKNFSMRDGSHSGLTSSASSSVFSSTLSSLQNFEDSRFPLNDGCSDRTHASFLIADVSPYGVRECGRVFAGLDSCTDTASLSSDESEHVPARGAPSPCSKRFITSTKKSTELERIVQSRRTDAGGLVQGIIHELDRSSGGCLLTGGTSGNRTITRSIGEARSTFVRSMIEALEQANTDNNASGDSNINDVTYIVHSEDEEVQSDDSTDSELAKSTSISVKSSDSPDDRTVTPLYSACSAEDEAESESDEEVYWAPCTLLELPRTSSRLSTTSSVLGAEARGLSPGLSPIKRERPEDWLQAAQQMQHATKAWNLAGRSSERSSSRQLFRIDETDFGYSDAFVSASPTIV